MFCENIHYEYIFALFWTFPLSPPIEWIPVLSNSHVFQCAARSLYGTRDANRAVCQICHFTWARQIIYRFVCLINRLILVYYPVVFYSPTFEAIRPIWLDRYSSISIDRVDIWTDWILCMDITRLWFNHTLLCHRTLNAWWFNHFFFTWSFCWNKNAPVKTVWSKI